MKVYTKTGDQGVTGLYDGTRLEKSEKIFDVLGTIDELSANIGVFLNLSHSTINDINDIQADLLTVGSIIASPLKPIESHRIVIDTYQLEKMIDALSDKMEPLNKFIIMNGINATSAQAHVCRTVCRRLEREMEKYGMIDRTITIYINRLSDYFFTLARYEAEKPKSYIKQLIDYIRNFKPELLK
jgi:cob(I)alamin adenosyltransferase